MSDNTKPQTATSNWANRTKAALSTVDASNLKPVGGGSLEEIATFVQFTTPKAGATKARQLNKDESVQGTYEGSFTTKKFNTKYYKIREAGNLVAVQGTGQLNKLMDKVVEGAEVKITYRGKEKIAKGAMAGKDAHSFFVAASEQKAQ